MPKIVYLPHPARPAASERRAATVHGELEQAFAAMLNRFRPGCEPVTPGPLAAHTDGLALRIVSHLPLAADHPAVCRWAVELSGRSALRERFFADVTRITARLPVGGAPIDLDSGAHVAIVGADASGAAVFGETIHHGRKKYTATATVVFAVDFSVSSFSAAPDGIAEAALDAARFVRWAGIGPLAVEAALRRYFATVAAGDCRMEHGLPPVSRTGFGLRVAAVAPPADPAFKDFTVEFRVVAADRFRLTGVLDAVLRLLPAERRTVDAPGGGQMVFAALFPDSQICFEEVAVCGTRRFLAALTVGCRVDVGASEPGEPEAVSPEVRTPVDPAALERALIAELADRLAGGGIGFCRGGLPLKRDAIGVGWRRVAVETEKQLAGYIFSLQLRCERREDALALAGDLRRIFPIGETVLGGIGVCGADLGEIRLEKIADQGRYKFQAEAELTVGFAV